MDLERIWDDEVFKSQIAEMPIFKSLIEQYIELQPFKGVKVAIAHVLVPNSLPMIFSVALGGADLIVTSYEGLKPDPNVVDFMQSMGLNVNLELDDASDSDVALDCGAYFLSHPPKYGLVEVTRSGVIEWEKNLSRVIVNADSGKSKLIETFFGNPISVIQNLQTFFGDITEYLKDKKVGIFGFGKIGKGNARIFKKYCDVKVFDINEAAIELANSLGFDTYMVQSDQKVRSEAIDIDILISSTGYKGVVSQFFQKSDLLGKLLLNLGAVDEFGDDYSEEEVFKSKHYPFNFNSDPPTPNMFIDAILAAQVEGLRYLVTTNLKPGLFDLPKDIDKWIVESFESLHDFDLSDIELYFPELNS